MRTAIIRRFVNGGHAMSSLIERPVLVGRMAADKCSAELDLLVDRDDRFDRLQSSLHKSTDKSEVRIKVEFSTNILNLPQLDLSIEGYLQVQCQRCMDTYALPVRQMTQYLLFDNEQVRQANSEQLEDRYETLLLPAPQSSEKARAGELDLIALIEDELLLSIPLYPRHADISDCSADALEIELLVEAGRGERHEIEQDEKQTPFAELNKLLKH